jgi:DNA-binding transcriptional LysR family regulator
VDLRAFDLNLLLSLDALLREESVTRAAKRMGVGQPAMSNALARLRDALGDPLLVRTGKGTALTDRARVLRASLPKLLFEIEGTLAPERAFDPSSHELTVRLRAADYAELTILAPLVGEIREVAPNVAVHVRPPGAKPADELSSGDVDLVIGVLRDAPADMFRQVLFRDEFAVVAAHGHRLGARPRLEAIANAPHVVVAPRGAFKSTRIDELLAKEGLERRVLAVVPQFSGVGGLVEGSDLIAILPLRAAHAIARGRALDVLPSPFEVPPQEVVQAWHARTHRDPAHAWFRARVAAVAAKVAADPKLLGMPPVSQRAPPTSRGPASRRK